MAKHRDLGRDSASVIWRTVVVAGAMLAAPLLASAGDSSPPAPPAKSEKAPSPTKAELAKQAAEVVRVISTQISELNKKIAASVTEVKNAKDKTARDTANATLSEQRKQLTELNARKKVAKAESSKADAAARAEASANKPRPRANDEIRPKGRGFVLS